MNFEQDISECCVCLGPFNEPKLLDCHHTFCLKCLEELVEHNSPKYMVKCPLCSKRSRIPEGGPENYTTNFYITKPANQDQVFCLNHSKMEADSYCKDCNEAVCSKCILRNHRSHLFIDLECEQTKKEIFEQFCKIQENMEKKMEELQIFRTIVADKSIELEDFSSKSIADVQQHVQNLCAIIKNMGANIVQEIEKNVDDNQSRLKKFTQEIDKVNEEMARNLDEMAKFHRTQTTAKVLETITKLEQLQMRRKISTLSIPDISCLSFVESKSKVTMEMIGCLLTVQSPLMISGFESLLSDELEALIPVDDLSNSAENSTKNLIDFDMNLTKNSPQCSGLVFQNKSSESNTSKRSTTIAVSKHAINSAERSQESKKLMDKLFQDVARAPIAEPTDLKTENRSSANTKVLITQVSRDNTKKGITNRDLAPFQVQLPSKRPTVCHTELKIDISDQGTRNDLLVLNGVTWSVSTGKLGNREMCVYLDLPIEGNSKINFCDVDCQLSIINAVENSYIRRKFENRKFHPGGDCGVGVDIDFESLTNPAKGFVDSNNILTVGIALAYKNIVFY